MQVRDLTGDGLVTKRRVQDGVGEFPIDCPIEDACVTVHYRSAPSVPSLYKVTIANSARL